MQNRNKLGFRGFPGGSLVKNLQANAGDVGSILGQDDPLEEETATQSSILAWRIHGQRSLVGYSPWSPKELDTIEQLTLHYMKSLN